MLSCSLTVHVTGHRVQRVFIGHILNSAPVAFAQYHLPDCSICLCIMAMDKDTSMIDWLVKKGMETDCMEIKYLQARKLLSGKVFLHFGHSHSCVFCLCGPPLSSSVPFRIPSLQHAKVPMQPPQHRPLHHVSPPGTRSLVLNTRSQKTAGSLSLRPC